ncbi:hypothetical protein TNCV_4579731 [Trichonephila clavipes]|nr:hypothetical protein TNCV_4579731 [Trichonephila clavipes]
MHIPFLQIFILALVAVATGSFEVIPTFSHYEGNNHHGNGISNRYFTKSEGLGYGLNGLRYDGYGLAYEGFYGLNGFGYVPYGYNGLGYYGYF